jgi:hypothetical protein
MVTTCRADLWDAMWAFKDHGKTHETGATPISLFDEYGGFA